MKKVHKRLSVALLLPLIGLSNASHAASKEEIAAEGKQVIKSFAVELKTTLQAAVKEGGLAKGIEACSMDAESIASKHSKGQWTISRTSLKARNSKNVPDPWEAQVLADFERQLAEGKPATKLVATLKDGDAFRMMKAIPTQGMCLACHGQSLSKDVKKTLLEKYPHDKATGYEAGQIRGAFSLVYRGE